MTNKKNYYDKLAKVDRSIMPDTLRESSNWVDKVTETGLNWETYDTNPTIKRVADLYFEKFDEWIKKAKPRPPRSKENREVWIDVERRRFVLISPKDGKKWANEFFKTEKEAKEFVKINDLILLDNPKGKATIPPKGAKPKKSAEDLRIANVKKKVKKIIGVKLPEDHPLHVLDRESPQFESALDEFLEEREKKKKEKPAAKKPEKKKTAAKPKKDAGAGKKKEPRHPKGGKLVALLDDDVKLIKRYAHLHGRIITDVQVMSLLDAVQKAILEKRITRHSKHWKLIDHIQRELVSLYNKLIKLKPSQAKIKLSDKDLKKYEKVGHSEVTRPSVGLLKRYISLDGKKVTKAKAVALIDSMERAIKSGKIKKSDPYRNEIDQAIVNLNKFIKAVPETLTIFKTELRGIMGKLRKEHFTRPRDKSSFPSARVAWETIADSTGLEPDDVVSAHTDTQWIWKIKEDELVSGVTSKSIKIKSEAGKKKVAEVLHEFKERELVTPQGKTVTDRKQAIAIALKQADKIEQGIKGVMSVGEVRGQKHTPIDLAAHWREVMGDMCTPTQMLVYGPGGSGKSGCVLQFVDHLAGIGFKILYVAGEQFDSPTFTRLLDANNIRGGENFKIVKDLNTLDPKDFDFVILDSKDSLNIDLEDFKALKTKFPKQSFIVVSQGKTDGEFRGGEQWRNEVDMLIRCEAGTASTKEQKNRWGGHNDIVIFKRA